MFKDSWLSRRWKQSDLQATARQQRGGCSRPWWLPAAGSARRSVTAANVPRWKPDSWSHNRAPPGSPGSTPARWSPAPVMCTQIIKGFTRIKTQTCSCSWAWSLLPLCSVWPRRSPAGARCWPPPCRPAPGSSSGASGPLPTAPTRESPAARRLWWCRSYRTSPHGSEARRHSRVTTLSSSYSRFCLLSDNIKTSAVQISDRIRWVQSD